MCKQISTSNPLPRSCTKRRSGPSTFSIPSNSRRFERSRSERHDPAGQPGRGGRRHRDRPQQLLHVHRRTGAGTGLAPHCVPLVSRSAQLSGLVYDIDCRASDVAGKHRTWLLDAPRDPTDPALVAHIDAGEAAGVHLGYKCSIRKPWWSTPSLWIPDLFLLRQMHLAPRLTVNAAAATSTDTVHRVRVKAGPEIDPSALAAVFHNSVTFAFAEIIGRGYGGGTGSWNPAKPSTYPFPHPRRPARRWPRMWILLLKANEIEKALDVVDRRVLIDGLGLSPDVVAHCRSAWIALRDRRTKRGSR